MPSFQPSLKSQEKSKILETKNNFQVIMILSSAGLAEIHSNTNKMPRQPLGSFATCFLSLLKRINTTQPVGCPQNNNKTKNKDTHLPRRDSGQTYIERFVKFGRIDVGVRAPCSTTTRAMLLSKVLEGITTEKHAS